MKYQATEAVVQNGKIVPIEPIEMLENTRFLLIKLDASKNLKNFSVENFRQSRGKFKGQLSTVEEFMAQKSQEKELNL